MQAHGTRADKYDKRLVVAVVRRAICHVARVVLAGGQGAALVDGVNVVFVVAVLGASG